MLRRRRSGLAGALVLACLLGAAHADQGDEAALKALHDEIVRMIGDAPCNNLVHCRVLPLGARPCGGPDEYLAYSSITGNKDLLESKAYEYGFLQEDVLRSRKARASCDVLPVPRAICLDQRCRLDTSHH